MIVFVNVIIILSSITVFIKQLPYSKHGPPDMTNEQDGIYAGPSTDGLIQSNTGKHLMVNLTKGEGQSNIGIFNIVLNATQQKG